MQSFRRSERTSTYFIPPNLHTLDGYAYCGNYKTYSHYNYLRPGLASWIKTWHFEAALELTSKYFYKCNVIDFGCADGILLPSLARYFQHVVGIDRDLNQIEIAKKVVSDLDNSNIELICNKDLTINQISLKLNKTYNIIFLLDVLEHIGDRNDMWGSRVAFLRELSTLIDKGIIVVSLPKMVGLPFILQRIGLRALKMWREPISLKDLIRAGIFNDTRYLEKKWEWDRHLGFNHKKLEKALKTHFRIEKKQDNFFELVWLLKGR